MSSRRNRSRRTGWPKYAIFAFVALVYVVKSCERSGPAPSPGPSAVENPIELMLRSPAPAERREGSAAAILVDTSGSMKESVKDADGHRKPKILIAHRAVLELIRQFDEFAAKHPDQQILVGVYEFSARERAASCRTVVPLAKPDLASAELPVYKMLPEGGTPIGDAMIHVKHDLDATGLSRRHILVVTDGENTHGYNPADVVEAIARQPEEERASVYFVAFDIKAERFEAVRNAGGLVLAAANERELKETLDYVLTGKILVEQPTPAGQR